MINSLTRLAGDIVNKMAFNNWLIVYAGVPESTANHYSSGTATISNIMLERGLISKDLFDMDIVEYELALLLIFADNEFIQKDLRGHRMYSCGLKHYRRCLLEMTDIYKAENAIELEIKSNSSISETEKDVIIKSRIGQGKFRDSLLLKYDHMCIVTGIDAPQLLIASHIKPWRVSSNEERVSCENGLLLSANYDRLFDTGLITFKNDGSIVISNAVSEKNRNILGLSKDIKVNLKDSSMLLQNLEYHRDKIYLSA